MNLAHLRATLLSALTLGATGCGRAVCEGGVSLLDDFGQPTGFEACPDGTIHRAEAVAVSSEVPMPRCQGTEDVVQCSTDGDCAEGPHGACVSSENPSDFDSGAYTVCSCVYSCETDAECEDGRVCVPAGLGSPSVAWSACAEAGCQTDEDCRSGECGLSVHNDGCGYSVALDCRERDDCRTEADCADSGSCALGDTGGGWACRTVSCAIGRPLLCEGEARVAPAARVQGWSGALQVALPPEGIGPELARRWTTIAAMEHASIASFARFTMELLSLGAPAELLALAQQAAADEVRHARLAYSIASALAGESIGPGPFALAGIGPAPDLRAFVLSLVAEACVGESIGAAEALAAAEVCTDEALRAALRGVAEDEARHAALAWRTLGWALRSTDAGSREELRTVADAALASILRVEDATHEPAFGLLGGAEARAVRARAARQVVVPLLERALGL